MKLWKYFGRYIIVLSIITFYITTTVFAKDNNDENFYSTFYNEDTWNNTYSKEQTQSDHEHAVVTEYDLYGTEKIVVSLGDSFSSGEGIPPFYGQYEDFQDRIVNTDYDWLAHRSTNSWPGQLIFPGTDQELKEHKNDGGWFFVASSGAECVDLLDGQDKDFKKIIYYHQNKNPNLYAKYHEAGNVGDELKPFIKDIQSIHIYSEFGHGENVVEVRYEGKVYLPPQLSVFNNIPPKETDFVTMSMGGNDVGFSTIVTAAYTKTSRTNFDYLDPNGIASMISRVKDEFDLPGGIRDSLKKAYYDVAEQAGYQAQIIIAGYPRLISPHGGLGFSQHEAQYIDDSCDYFDEKLIELVEECSEEGLNISFCDVRDVFNTHEASSLNRYIHTVMLISREEDLIDFDKNSAYSMHPNDKGAQAYASCVQTVMNRIAENMLKYHDELKKNFMDSDVVIGDFRRFFFGDFNCDGHNEAFGISGTSFGKDLKNARVYYIEDKDSLPKEIAYFETLYGYGSEIKLPRIANYLNTDNAKYFLVGGNEGQPVYIYGVRNISENGVIISSRHELGQYTFKNTYAEEYELLISGKYIDIYENSDTESIYSCIGIQEKESEEYTQNLLKYDEKQWEFITSDEWEYLSGLDIGDFSGKYISDDNQGIEISISPDDYQNIKTYSVNSETNEQYDVDESWEVDYFFMDYNSLYVYGYAQDETTYLKLTLDNYETLSVDVYKPEYGSGVYQHIVYHRVTTDDVNSQNQFLEYLKLFDEDAYYSILNIKENGDAILLIAPSPIISGLDSATEYQIMDNNSFYCNQCQVYYLIDGEVMRVSNLESFDNMLSLYEKDGKYYIRTSHNGHSVDFHRFNESGVYTCEYDHGIALEDSTEYYDNGEIHYFSGNDYYDAVDKYSEIEKIIFRKFGSNNDTDMNNDILFDSYKSTYEPVLQFYRKNILNEWNDYYDLLYSGATSQKPELDISWLWGYYSDLSYSDKVGYSLIDLDDNGIPELIISLKTEDFDVPLLLDAYTISSGEITHMFSSMNMAYYSILEDKTILYFVRESFGTYIYALYKVVEDKLVNIEAICTEESDEGITIYYSKGIDMEQLYPSADYMDIISEKTQMEVMDRWSEEMDYPMYPLFE